MNEISYKSFQDTVAALLEASPNNSNKGKVMKEWFSSNFSVKATVSNIKEDKQIGNRVVEQFKHNCPIVVFVFDSSLRSDTILNKIHDNVYSALQTVTFVDAEKPYNIVQLFTTEQNTFTLWAEENAGIQSQPFPFPIDESHKEKYNIKVLNDEDLVDKVRDSFLRYWEIIDQHGVQSKMYVRKYEEELNAILKRMDIGISNIFEVANFDNFKSIISLVIDNDPSLSYLNDEKGPEGNRYYIWSTNRHYKNFLEILSVSDFFANINLQNNQAVRLATKATKTDKSYLRAMRTKPFLLLAGISGTGKSRLVKQMAYDSCPQGPLRDDPTSPGNYCLIEVKPNWHDSTELLGYKSLIVKPHYEIKPFVKFIVKAMLNKKVPFFVCLDEMNLAPVEQYFAEFLSVLESRKRLGNGDIVSEPIIDVDAAKLMDFNELFGLKQNENNADAGAYVDNATSDIAPHYGAENALFDEIKEHGIRLPENLIVIGTVNMDETTHQFSRKVIDRAMTIEMNLPEGKDADGNDIDPFMDFFKEDSDLVYRENPESSALYLSTRVRAADVVAELAAANAEKTEWLKTEVAKFLNALNTALDNTPFKIAYRVQNELMLYFYQLWYEDKSADWERIFATSADQILMMKVLPRIEGDEELLEPLLDKNNGTLVKFVQDYPNASKKVTEMSDRLEQSRFTSFWP